MFVLLSSAILVYVVVEFVDDVGGVFVDVVDDVVVVFVDNDDESHLE